MMKVHGCLLIILSLSVGSPPAQADEDSLSRINAIENMSPLQAYNEQGASSKPEMDEVSEDDEAP